MLSGFSDRKKDYILLRGIDHGGKGKILAENDLFIVIKWPAHTAWNGIGSTKYYSAETIVYQKTMKNIGALGDSKNWKPKEYLTPIIEWQNTRKKKEIK